MKKKNTKKKKPWKKKNFSSFSRKNLTLQKKKEKIRRRKKLILCSLEVNEKEANIKKMEKENNLLKLKCLFKIILAWIKFAELLKRTRLRIMNEDLTLVSIKYINM